MTIRAYPALKDFWILDDMTVHRLYIILTSIEILVAYFYPLNECYGVVYLDGYKGVRSPLHFGGPLYQGICSCKRGPLLFYFSKFR